MQTLKPYYQKAHAIVVLNHTSAAEVAPYTKTPLHVIPAAINLQSFNKPISHLSQKTFTRYHIPAKPSLLYVGRLAPEKSLPTLLHAWQLIACQFPKFQLLIIGDGPKHQALEKQVRRHHISSQVVFAELVSPQNLPAIYTHPQIKAFCMPSTTETLSIATLQAMAAGIPIIASNTGALKEIITREHTSLLVPPHQPTQLAKAIHLLLTTPSLAHTLTTHAYQTITRYRPQTIKSQYQNLYNSLINHQ